MTALTWLRALKDTARSGLSIDRASLAPLVAIRGAAGVATVIEMALYFGSPDLAVSVAFGAFASAIATFQSSWRPRPVMALGAAAGLAISTLCGYLLMGIPVAFAALLAVWAFGAGMSWRAGDTAGVVTGLTVAVMLITTTLPGSLLAAFGHAALIAMGGVVQALFIVIFPVRPWGDRREALADALASVADYARELRDDPMATFDPEPLIEARDAAAVSKREARRRPRQLHGYRALAERFRPALASLADPVVGGTPTEGPVRDRVREMLGAAATVLDATARAIRHGERVRIPEEALEVLQVPDQGAVLSRPAKRAALQLIALTDQAVEAAQEPVEVTRTGLLPRISWYRVTGREGEFEGAKKRAAKAGTVRPGYLHRPSLPSLIPVAARTFQQELRWSSPIFRHAIRVSVVVVVGYLLGQWLPPLHGYWIPLTAVMVLRPDFSRTFERGFARFAGTLLGVTIGGVVTSLIEPGPYLSAGIAVSVVLVMYLLTGAGYVVASTCTGAYVVFLLEIGGELGTHTAFERAWLTAIGGGLAMLSYIVFFPAWHTTLLRHRLADWVSANGRYAIAVLDCFARPAERKPRQVREALLEARNARQYWEETVERASAEPVRHRGRISKTIATDAHSAMVTMGRSMTMLEAHIPDRDAQPSEAAGEFAAALAPAVAEAADAVRRDKPVQLEPIQEALDRWWLREPSPPPVALRAAQLWVEALSDLATALAKRRSSSG